MLNESFLDIDYINYLKTKCILVVGITLRSGVSVSNTLFNLKIKHALSDSKNYEELAVIRENLLDKNALFFAGKQDENILNNIDFLILSPGVAVSSNFIQMAVEKNIEIVSEIEFAYRLIPFNNYVAITGTDGKTTTSTLTYEILKNTKKSTLCGNIGEAFSKHIFDIEKDENIILELSSFQLETIKLFKPKISVILNIAQDHLDRYNSIDDYFNAKKNIYKNQDKNDYLIINLDNKYTRTLLDSIKNVSIKTFSCIDSSADLFLNDNDDLFYNNNFLFSIKKRVLIGGHNRENILASVLIALLLNIDEKIIENEVLTFNGVAHRLEYVATIDGVTFINDSKATSLSAVVSAIKSFDKNTILIMGGRNKAVDFSSLAQYMKGHVKKLILTGEACHELNKMINYENTKIIVDFDVAIQFAKKVAKKGDTVLLSPGCTSFDRFKDFEERGEYFKSLVRLD